MISVVHRTLSATPLLLAALVGLAVALRAPLGTTVIGLMLFGVFHNLFELRYLAGRFVIGRLTSRTAWLLAAPILAVVLVRATSGSLLGPLAARHAEVALVYGSLVLAALTAPRPALLRAGIVALLVIAGAASWHWVQAHYLVLAHLHNLMPVVFLLTHRSENRGAVAGACVVWGLVIPAALLSGLLDPLLDFSAAFAAGPVDVDAAERLRAGWAPPTAEPEAVTRIATTFSYLQWMHYFIWIFYLPRFTAAPQASGRLWGLLFGPAGFVVALVVTLVLVPVYLTSYLSGFGVYSALASFHALVEFPILLAVLLGSAAEPRPDELRLAHDAAV